MRHVFRCLNCTSGPCDIHFSIMRTGQARRWKASSSETQQQHNGAEKMHANAQLNYSQGKTAQIWRERMAMRHVFRCLRDSLFLLLFEQHARRVTSTSQIDIHGTAGTVGE